MSIEAAAQAWRQHSAVFLGVSEYQAARGCKEVLRIAEACGWMSVADFDRTALTDWLVQQIAAEQISRVTAGKLLSYWSVFGEWLVERGHWRDNDVRRIKLPRCKASDRGPGARAFSVAEVKALIRVAAEQERTCGRAGKYGPNRSTLYLFLAHTGLRYSEAMRLRWENVDVAARRIRVREDKAGRGDTIPIHDEAVEALLELRRVTGAGEGPIFRKVSHHTLEADMERAGVERRVGGQGGLWHSFRKMSVTERLRRGADPEFVRRLARHQKIDLTLGTYNQRQEQELRDAVEKIPRLGAENVLKPGGIADSVIPSRHAQQPPQQPDDAPRPVPVEAWRDNSAPAGQAAQSGHGERSPAGLTAAIQEWSRGESNPRLQSDHTAEMLEQVAQLLMTSAKAVRGLRSPEHGQRVTDQQIRPI